MAEFNYKTRREIMRSWINWLEKRGKKFSHERLFFQMATYGVSEKAQKLLEAKVTKNPNSTLGEIFKRDFRNLVQICVPEGKEEEFYYAVNQLNQYQMTAGWERRSVRGTSYLPFVRAAVEILLSYSWLNYFQVDLIDLWLGKAEPEIIDFTRNEYWRYAELLAAEIDMGNEKTIEGIRDIFLGENNTSLLTNSLIAGIVMSKNQELYKLLGDFLLAARLQEGVRQAVCETMDAGRPEAFLYLFQVIEDNNLIRYSSVKRAVSTWIGIFDENSVDRITNKLLNLMGQCLRDKALCEELLKSEDSIAISCALWAKGFYDADDAIQAVIELVKHGTRHQKMTASVFNRTLQYEHLKLQAAKEVIFQYSEDLELVACFFPSFIVDVYSRLRDVLVENKGYYYYSLTSEAAKKPRKIPIDGLFDSEEEAEAMYHTLKDIMARLPKKGIEINPCIFPKYRVRLKKSDLASRLCLLAWILQKEEYLDEAAEWIPLIGGDAYEGITRAAAARVLLYKPTSRVKKDVLIELLHNPEESTRGSACELAKVMDWKPEDYRTLERNLKYKKGRAAAILYLKKQKPEAICGTIERLLQEKAEEYHMGALNLALEIKKENPKQFEKIRPKLALLTAPTGKEQLLLGELTDAVSEAQDILKQPGYGLYDTTKEWVLPPAEVDLKRAEKLFQYQTADYLRVLQRLDDLIVANQHREYKTAFGDERTLSVYLWKTAWQSSEEFLLHPIDGYPFKELWLEFYDTEIKDAELLLELYLYEQCYMRCGDYQKNIGLYKKVFGSGLLKKAPFEELSLGNLKFKNHISTILYNLFIEKVSKEQRVDWGLAVIAKMLSVLDDSNDTYVVEYKRYDGTVEKKVKMAAKLPIFSEAKQWLLEAEGEEWKRAFTLSFKLMQHYEKLKTEPRSKEELYTRPEAFRLFVQSYVRGIWDKDLFYKAVFQFYDITDLFGAISSVEQKGLVSPRNINFYGNGEIFDLAPFKTADGRYQFDRSDNQTPELMFAHELYQEIIPKVLKVEMKRGEQPTPFSKGIGSIQVVYGIDTFIEILTALGKDKLVRETSYSYCNRDNRNQVLSHLLRVCRPYPHETAADLKKALKGTDIAKKRLVEAAMFSKQWIPMVEECLKLSGFQSGCYYFMAHTSEQFDEYTTSMLAKYTPLSPEELHDGAFDINWFFEAYKKLGEKEFALLYDAAKYTSNGIAHGRARKYADAALGKVTVEALKTEIDAKRNKDLLMSIGLVPLSKAQKKREAEMLERYQFIQKFKKESRQFGAQRRASEGRAVEIALRNLSVAAGFSDVTRLTLRMETKLAESIGVYLEWKALDEETKLRICVDETGKSRLECQKKDKLLKSIPARLKKNELVLEYQEIHKKLKAQYSRTKQMLEQAMEDRTSFTVCELLDLQKNPVVRPIVEPLVVRTANEAGLLGFLTPSGLMDYSGTVTAIDAKEAVFIAHPFDLYQDGHWHEYQKYLFEHQLRQPFKQVFRELYVKLDDELEKHRSLMFAGNQIQPQKTVGALKSRRWVADYDDGLQKIYYRENIVAQIYAMADWFSPSDIEAPTLEFVEFSNRKTFQPISIRDIPDIIYSEVMRDVDLAVSVAHAGGVDPETSHSTVEMRRAIVSCNLELFGIKNVTLRDNHAFIEGKRASYTVHLGSGVVHQAGGSMLYVIPVHSQHRGRIFLPFIDEDPKTAEIMSKILLFAEDEKIKDPKILTQIQ